MDGAVTGVRVGVVVLPDRRWAEARPHWVRAEELGFDHAWTYDHLAWRTLREGPWFGAVPTLAAAAGATTTIPLGFLVASPNFRHPVAFGREVTALDDLSDGRLVLGLGAGGTGWDATVLGHAPLTPRERADRFAEFVDHLDRLLRQPDEPPLSVDGDWFSAADAFMLPGCRQRPRVPFAVAATGPRGMDLAVRHAATWVTTGDVGTVDTPIDAATGAAQVAGQMARLDERCAAAGRDPATLARCVLTGLTLDPGLSSPEHFRDTLGRYAEVGVTDLVVHWPREAEPYAGDRATFERAVIEGRS
jgi:alkanesulfonate monooxygenase SsuD/methylene tetrahydromethanopterin reductase-like flavin-dependent oxidoreductase (luciferase family)